MSELQFPSGPWTGYFTYQSVGGGFQIWPLGDADAEELELEAKESLEIAVQASP